MSDMCELTVGDDKKIQVVAKVLHGSHLYGLNTEESDHDYKLIYIPTHYDLLMGKAKESYDLGTNKGSAKNTAEDVDFKVYSFPKFVQMLIKGDMVSMDMLFAPDSHIEFYGDLESNPFYQLRLNYQLFTAKEMAGYAGYVHKQAAKYGIKGSRVATVRELLSELDAIKSSKDTEGLRLGDVLEGFSVNLPYAKITPEHFEVLGAKHQLTVKLSMFEEWLQNKMKEYGDRSLKAETNQGVDWKAMSHAVRACIQLRQMLTTGKMELPLPDLEREAVLNVKQGQVPFKAVESNLYTLMELVDDAKANSELPDSIDKGEVEAFTYELILKFWGITL